jgi:hypothetical protein
MSSSTPISPFDPASENWWSKGTSNLAKRLCDVGSFVRSLGVQMRFGELTRAPLRLVRFQLKENVAECDWLARSQDAWDTALPPHIGERHASLQALKDAVEVRELLFHQLPDVDAAYLRIYRETSVHSRELIICGYVNRSSSSFRNVHSMAMRAKLVGFRFSLDSETLRTTREMSNLELVDW